MPLTEPTRLRLHQPSFPAGPVAWQPWTDPVTGTAWVLSGTTGTWVQGQLWTPAAITTALWLDAADATTVIQGGGQVTSWTDKSGNNATATALGNPQYNSTGLSTSLPAVELDGTGDFFTSSITGIGSFNALDVYMVMQSTAAAAADANTAVLLSYGNFSNASGVYPAQRGLAVAGNTGSLLGETILVGLDNALVLNGRLGSSSYTRAAATAQILNPRLSTTGTTLFSNASQITLNLSSSMNTATNSAPSSIGYTVDSDLHIGALRAGGSLSATPASKYSEFIVCSTPQSLGTRQRIEGYLAHKWGLTGSLPAGHPYKTTPPYI